MARDIRCGGESVAVGFHKRSLRGDGDTCIEVVITSRCDDGRRHGVVWRRDVARCVPHRAWEHVLDGSADEKVQRVARARGTAAEAAAYW